MTRSSRKLESALFVQLGYAGLVIAWQLTGVVLIELGSRSPGPSASLQMVVVAIAIAGGLILGLRKFLPLFVVLSLASGLAAGGTIMNAFTADPLLWPNDLSRYAGVAINAVGVVGGVLALWHSVFTFFAPEEKL